MSYEVDYLPVAVATGANVDTQANFAGSGYQLTGFQNGVAQPYQAMKIWRQASMVAAAVANFISNTLNIAVLDDGNIANLITNLTSAIKAAAIAATSGVISVAYSATPIFDASQGSTFEIVLTGNVTSSTLVNVSPGQTLTFIVKQDATGNRAFAAPANLPIAAINEAASSTNVQEFIVDSGSNVYAKTPLISQ